MLGVPTAIGRPFTAGSRRRGASAPCGARLPVLAIALQRRPGVIGQRLTLNNESFDVVGVLPESYRAVPTDALIFTHRSAPWCCRRSPTATTAMPLACSAVSRPHDARASADGRQHARPATRAGDQDNRGMGQPARLVPLQVREFGGWQEPLLISSVPADVVRPGAAQRLRQRCWPAPRLCVSAKLRFALPSAPAVAASFACCWRKASAWYWCRRRWTAVRLARESEPFRCRPSVRCSSLWTSMRRSPSTLWRSFSPRDLVRHRSRLARDEKQCGRRHSERREPRRHRSAVDASRVRRRAGGGVGHAARFQRSSSGV